MERLPYDPYQAQQNAKGPRAFPLVMMSLIAAAGLLAGVLFLYRERRVLLEVSRGGEEVQALPTSGDYPSSVLREIPQPAGGQWLLPVDTVSLGGAYFVLDTGNNRVLKLDQDGTLLDVFDKASDERLDLQQPMALTSDGSRLFIANSLAASVIVLDPSGPVEQVLPLRPSLPGEKTPRPIGIAVTLDGRILVSDADNHRVLFLDGEGRVIQAVGTGTRTGGVNGFNVPGSLALDSAGNIYVVDTLNARVVELSPKGAFIRQFGQRGDTAGTLSRPKGVAVDAAGRVFVSDGLLAAVQVFAPDGTFLGMIGRRAPGNADSGSLFQAPAGLSIAGDWLYVTDRFAGLFTLQLSGAATDASK
jgi:sugar lactone lactonase YvrE